VKNLRAAILEAVGEYLRISGLDVTADNLTTTYRPQFRDRLKQMRSGLPRPGCTYVPPIDKEIDKLLKEFPDDQ
jgi:hypothetical protein